MKGQLLFGYHAIAALLQHKPERLRLLQVQEGLREKHLTDLINQAKHHHISIESVKKATLDKLSHNAVHQGVIAHCQAAPVLDEVDLTQLLDDLEQAEPAQHPFLLFLDGVQDPHNLGACLRSALAAGVHAVVVPRDNSCGLTPIVHKVAVGAADIIPFVQVTNLSRCIKSLQQRGIWFVGAEMQGGKPLYDVDLTGPIAWVLGAEGRGLRENTKKHCDHLAYIPMSGAVESLNVSVATGICLFETRRQQR